MHNNYEILVNELTNQLKSEIDREILQQMRFFYSEEHESQENFKESGGTGLLNYRKRT